MMPSPFSQVPSLKPHWLFSSDALQPDSMQADSLKRLLALEVEVSSCLGLRRGWGFGLFDGLEGVA